MFGFLAPTPADWLPRVLRQPDEVLLDHAHCERKAAGAAVSLLFRAVDHPSFLEPLSLLASERFRILADALPDRELARFYRGLLAAEARHHGIYVDLAAELMPRPEVRARLRELALHEAHVLTEMPALPRLHT